MYYKMNQTSKISYHNGMTTGANGMGRRVMAAMSGGVDSTAAALLLADAGWR
jgi:tRNA(Ile)-lysidine synthase TilS/MesJ